MSRLAARMQEIAPFQVMQILARARALEAQGHDVVHMEIGEPDFVSPQPVIAAAQRALDAGATHYTPAAGLPGLRDAIAGYYRRTLSVDVDPARVLVTPGASGALQLVLGVLLDAGDRVAVTDPGYPCNRHIVSLFGGQPVPIPVDKDTGYMVPESALAEVMKDDLRALMVASPANPTGKLIELDALQALQRRLSRQSDAVLVCDEIYQGLQYDEDPSTALALGAENVVVINSFSKFFGMTGWRVGWVVAPEWMIEPMERLAQNIFLAAPTLGQHAALAAFTAETAEILERRRVKFRERRDFLYGALRELGFGIDMLPQGAFYLYADVSRLAEDGAHLCEELLERAKVALTPGSDFGQHQARRHVRFAYTTDIANLERGVERLRRFLRAGT